MNGELTKALVALLAIFVLAAAVLLVVGILMGVRRLRPRGRAAPPEQQVNDPWGLNLPRKQRDAAGPLEGDQSAESNEV